MLCMVLGVSWKEKVSNDVLYGQLPELSDKIRSRRLKLAGHCIRHPELLANDLVTWEPEARRGDIKRRRPRQNAELPVNVTKERWDKHKRGTANPDTGQGNMEEDIC